MRWTLYRYIENKVKRYRNILFIFEGTYSIGRVSPLPPIVCWSMYYTVYTGKQMYRSIVCAPRKM